MADSKEHSSELAQSEAWERRRGYDSSVIGMEEDAAEREEVVVVDEVGLRWSRAEVESEEGVKACTDVARRQVVNVDVILGLMILVVVGIILVGIKIGCGVLNNDIRLN